MCKRAAAADELARDRELDCLLTATQLSAEPVEPDRTVERSERDVQGRIEFVQMPAQPLLRTAALVDEVVAMIDEEFQLAQRLLVLARPFEPRLLERLPSPEAGR